MLRSLVLAVSVLLGCSYSSNALSSMPGSCNSPIPVGSSHIASNPDGNGAISEGGFSVTMGDMELSEDGVNTLPAGEYQVTLKATETDFRGFLMRLSSETFGDTTEVVSEDSDDVQILQACTDLSVGSLAHNNPELKAEVGGTINWPMETSDIVLEVTVVVSNQAESVWYTTKFMLETTGMAAPGPTSTPDADAPTKAPTDPPSIMPSLMPSGARAKSMSAAFAAVLVLAIAIV